MIPVSDIYGKLAQAFPLDLAEGFDNCGLLVGDSRAAVDTVLVALDITDGVIGEAEKIGAQLIVSHHPLFFRGAINSITDSTAAGARIMRLIRGGIAAVCMHTNADSAAGGVNDLLAAAVGLTNVQNLGGGDSGMLGRIGDLSAEYPNVSEYAKFAARALSACGARVCDSGKKCSRVAVGGGSCGEFLELAASRGADTFITADVKYHIFHDAQRLGVNLIDLGHFPTEAAVRLGFADIIARNFPSVRVQLSQINRDPIFFIMP